MQEAAPALAAPDVTDEAPAAGPDLPRLAWTDGSGAAKWMKTLPLSGVGQAYAALLGQLRAMTAADLPPRERATIAELARDPVAHLHTELARRYAGKPQPAGEREREAADQAIALWQALWVQYSSCLKPLLEGDTELQGVKAKLLQRALYVGKQLVIVHALARRVAPPSLWQELHAYYRLTEMLDCATVRVSDPLMPDSEGLSCFSMYSHALLIALADPYALTVRQIELVDRWLGQWARKLFPCAQQREDEGALILVDLEGERGAVLANAAPGTPSPSMRFGYPGKLATSIRGRLKRLANGASPADLELGDDVSQDAAIALLTHLDAHWLQVPRNPQRTKSRALDLAAGGTHAAYFRVSGHSFAGKDPLGRDNENPTKYLQAVGGVSDFDRHREEAERNWPWEKWYGAAEWREAAVKHPGATHYEWFLDQLVIVREEGRVRLGHVSRLAAESEGDLSLSVRIWAGDPKAYTVRMVNQDRTEDPPTPALLLSGTPEEPSTLVMSPRAFNAGRIMRMDEVGSHRRFRLLRIVQRGADFERVVFETVEDD
ncbi:MAG: hypothetical protein ACM3QY_01135 [Candidatus Levyibacteriota bacterium]